MEHKPASDFFLFFQGKEYTNHLGLSHASTIRALLNCNVYFKEVCSENNELRRGLAENHLELAMIKSELAHVRADYEHKQNELIRQKGDDVRLMISSACHQNCYTSLFCLCFGAFAFFEASNFGN